ncbi:MAG: Maf family nucleotide pyrophosphatase [Pedobacter sp.]|nr:Maf family nucleotide pyrophosphatase [Pedobacter sp.]MDQ8053371.1 Maf family nucleotide pyrophosphatase [Pedobacter sp.]
MPKPIILASKSPRRQELMKLLGLDFTIELKDVDESYPEGLNPAQIAMYISEKKASAFAAPADQIVLTADTIVAINNEILGKPKDREDAQRMLRMLSGAKHEVYTGVTLVQGEKILSFNEISTVFCRSVGDDEIDFYIDQYQPFDKAGSYGIQDWWGLAVVQKIDGSYTNVMGLPTERLYRELGSF